MVELVKKFLEEKSDDIRVCENLGSTNYFEKRKKLRPGQNFDFEDVFSDDTRRDSVSETFRYPIRAVFQSSGMSNLLKEILEHDTKSLSDEEKTSFFDKMGFYARATQVAADLYQHKEDYEMLGNRSAHLGVLAKIAALKPELANDPAFVSSCEELQNSIKNKEVIDIKKERAEIIKVIQESGLSYEDLDFHPSSFIKLTMETSDKGINLKMTDDGSSAEQN